MSGSDLGGSLTYPHSFAVRALLSDVLKCALGFGGLKAVQRACARLDGCTNG